MRTYVRIPRYEQGASRWPSRRAFYRELLEDPPGIEPAAALLAVSDRHVVACARVHRQPAFGRIPLVVLVDQLVDVVEGPRLGQLAPVARELLGVVAVLLTRPVVRAVQSVAVTMDSGLDLVRPLDEAR